MATSADRSLEQQTIPPLRLPDCTDSGFDSASDRGSPQGVCYEAYCMSAADLRSKVERLATDPPRAMPVPEREQRSVNQHFGVFRHQSLH